MADQFVQALLNVTAESTANARAVVPGKVTSVDRSEGRERDVTVSPGIGRRMAGDEVGDGPVAGAPVLYPGGGGWSFTWPIDTGDECLGLAADRNSIRWRQNREPAEAHSIDRSHDLSDLMVLPVSITAASGAPADIGDDFVIAHTEGGERLRIERGGAITITKTGAPVASIALEAGGSVTIEVTGGQSVNIGGPAALSLATNDALIAAIDVFIAALVAAGAGAAYAGAGAAQTAWNGVKNTFATQKAKGE